MAFDDSKLRLFSGGKDNKLMATQFGWGSQTSFKFIKLWNARPVSL